MKGLWLLQETLMQESSKDKTKHIPLLKASTPSLLRFSQNMPFCATSHLRNNSQLWKISIIPKVCISAMTSTCRESSVAHCAGPGLSGTHVHLSRKQLVLRPVTPFPVKPFTQLSSISNFPAIGLRVNTDYKGINLITWDFFRHAVFQSCFSSRRN